VFRGSDASEGGLERPEMRESNAGSMEKVGYGARPERNKLGLPLTTVPLFAR